jgi:hypothetical protein
MNNRLVKNDMGQNKGFGFCEFQNEAAAEAAIRVLNNYEMNGRLLRVRTTEFMFFLVAHVRFRVYLCGFDCCSSAYQVREEQNARLVEVRMTYIHVTLGRRMQTIYARISVQIYYDWVCMYTYMHTYTCANRWMLHRRIETIHRCIYACVYECMCVIYVCMRASVRNVCACVRMHVCMYISLSTLTHIYTYIHTGGRGVFEPGPYRRGPFTCATCWPAVVRQGGRNGDLYASVYMYV